MRQVTVRNKSICLRASYTIEAALLLPLFLFVILKGLLLGIECYEDVCIASECVESTELTEPAERIWNMQLARKGVDWIYEHTVSEKPEE